MKMSKTRQYTVYSAIVSPIIDYRIARKHFLRGDAATIASNDIDVDLSRLGERIFKRVLDALNVKVAA